METPTAAAGWRPFKRAANRGALAVDDDRLRVGSRSGDTCRLASCPGGHFRARSTFRGVVATDKQRRFRRITTVDTAWREHASCRFTGPDLFFPAGSTGGAVDEIQAAKAVCQACQVRGACLQFALETRQENGI
jgi:hypothetical protein